MSPDPHSGTVCPDRLDMQVSKMREQDSEQFSSRHAA
jgi:hypothetical protein